MITNVLREIFRRNLAVKRNERVLVFTDRPSESEQLEQREAERRMRLSCVAFLAAETGRLLAREVVCREFPATGVHGAEPPALLWEAAFGRAAIAALRRRRLLDSLIAKTITANRLAAVESIIRQHRRDAVQAVLALSHYSTSHTRFRDLLTRICGSRYASMPLFDMALIEGPLLADTRAVAARTKRVGRALTGAQAIEVRTPNGTRLHFSVAGRKPGLDTGMLTRAGSFGNLPAGEAYIAPVEGTAEGNLVLEWAPSGELASPVTLTVRGGQVQDVLGKDPYALQLAKKLAERVDNRNIAEFGIGTNDCARRPDNILEAEKILGTIHLALGDNSSFGGTVQTPFHQDFVFFRPTVSMVSRNGRKTVLMKQGRFTEAAE